MHAEMLSSERVYPCQFTLFTRIYLLCFPLIGIVATGFGLLTFLPSLNESFADSVGVTLAGIAVFVAMMYMYKAIKRTRHVLTDDGIIYYGWGFRIYTPWQNVIGFGSVKPYPFTLLANTVVQGLQLRHPCVLGMKLVEGRRQGVAMIETDWWNPASTMAPFAGILPIPQMRLYRRKWRDTELGKDLPRYVPRIFE